MAFAKSLSEKPVFLEATRKESSQITRKNVFYNQLLQCVPIRFVAGAGWKTEKYAINFFDSSSCLRPNSTAKKTLQHIITVAFLCLARSVPLTWLNRFAQESETEFMHHDCSLWFAHLSIVYILCLTYVFDIACRLRN